MFRKCHSKFHNLKPNSKALCFTPPHLHSGMLICPPLPAPTHRKVMVMRTQPIFIVFCFLFFPIVLFFPPIVSLPPEHFAYCHQVCLPKIPLPQSNLHCSHTEFGLPSHPPAACTHQLTTSEYCFSVQCQLSFAC